MPSSLPTLDEARRAIAARLAPLAAETVAVEAALGRVTAAAVAAADPLPGFDNSAMDGFAVRAADTPGALRVAGEARAGRPASRALAPGEAIRISTGAMLPQGADAVARREIVRPLGAPLRPTPPARAEREGGGGEREAVEVLEAVVAGRDVRREGEEVVGGGVVVPGRRRLGAAEVGALVAAGVTEVSCVRRPRVVLVVTGDELTGPGRVPARGAIRESNRTTLAALAGALGAEVVAARLVPDDRAATVAAVTEALGDADLLVTCGGMSVGPHDHVRAALEAAGVTFDFAGVALAPGRPAAFGTGPGGQAVTGLPGNPLSALVTFRLLAEAALDALAPGTADGRTVLTPAAAPLPARAGSTLAVPCRVGPGGAHPLPASGHGPTAALGAHGLALVPPRADALPAGERVEVALM